MKQKDTPAPEERSSSAPARKAYHKPQVQIYGDLAEITKTNSGSNANDGGGHPNKHYTS